MEKFGYYDGNNQEFKAVLLTDCLWKLLALYTTYLYWSSLLHKGYSNILTKIHSKKNRALLEGYYLAQTKEQ